jgi:hypothetical protein
LIFRAKTHCFVLLAGSALAACGSPGDARTPEEAAQTDSGGGVVPASQAERQVLGALDQLPPDSEQSVGGLAVSAGAPYHSASGRTCRRVTLKAHSGAPAGKLACKSQQDGWVFVPGVFADTQGG